MEKEKKWLNRFLIIGFIVFSTAFLAFMNSEPHTLSWLVKTVPIACLALFAFLNMPGKRLLGAGLVFSGIGDILLELPVEGLFEAGIGAFILAMGVSACLGRYTNGIIITGAVLFIISDALIAYPMFVAPIAHSSFWVMFSYYAAQALLTWGTLKMKPQR